MFFLFVFRVSNEFSEIDKVGFESNYVVEQGRDRMKFWKRIMGLAMKEV